MELKKSEYRALGNNGTENPVKPEAGDREKQNPAGPRARPECGIGSVAQGASGESIRVSFLPP